MNKDNYESLHAPGPTEHAKNLHDRTANTYENDLVSFGYTAPTAIAATLRELGGPYHKVLDLGCGTGLSGQAIRQEVLSEELRMDGWDVSEAMLEVCKSKEIFDSLSVVDLQDCSTWPEAPEGKYDAVTMAGVMTYIENVDKFLQVAHERLLAPGGILSFTHREDLYAAQDWSSRLAEMCSSKPLWKIATLKRNQTYMTGINDYVAIAIIGLQKI